MAEDQATKQGDAGGNSSTFLRTLIIVSIIALSGALLALAFNYFVLAPLIGGGSAAGPTDPKEVILEGVQVYEFPEERVTVLMDDPEVSPPLLIFKVAMACDSLDTHAVVTNNQAWFRSMLLKLHRNRTLTELSDPYVQESILKQAKQEAGALLNKFGVTSQNAIIEVMYVQFTIFDL